MPTRQFSWYDAVYGGFADEANATIRAEAFDEEIASGKTRHDEMAAESTFKAVGEGARAA
jgi:hypothetical protein